jgi:hypothetical protein
MKKLIFATFLPFMVLSCTDTGKKEDDASKKGPDMNALYEKNLASLKTGITAFEKKDIEGWAATIADSAVWHSPAYGDSVTTKAHWKEALKNYMDNWDNLNLSNATFLPGIDSATHQPDGSVRYYGTWNGVHKSGVATHIRFYGTYDFNKDNKTITGTDFFDVGGLMNAIASKAKK